jgi:hypothetical protein
MSIIKFGLFFSFLTLAACSPPPLGEQSILLITIANFRGDELECGSTRDSITPQLDEICNESVRFTHAYTSSTLVNPALASLLTGLYPAESGVHRNDAGRYEENVKTVSRFAHEQGLESLFVSGGVPVLRKSAVSRGFDFFDDSVRAGGSFYRPADEVVKRFLSLLAVRSAGAPFFGVLHFADREFSEVPSLKTNQNEKREGQEIGKLQEIDDAIGVLRAYFQKIHIWDKITVVVVGLQGSEKSEHGALSKGINLYDESVRVPLLIKPSRKTSDHPVSWKIDSPVSLVDVGGTLFKILGSDDYPISKLPFRNLMTLVEGHSVILKEVPLFSETDLPAWRGWGPRLVSMRLGEWNYMLVPEAKLFNTFTDRNELHSVGPTESPFYYELQKIWLGFRPFFEARIESGKYFLPVSVSEKLRVAKTVFSHDASIADKISELDILRLRRPQDWQIVQWEFSIILEKQDWPEMKRFLKKLHPTTSEARHEFMLWNDFISLKLRLVHLEMASDPELECLYLAVALKRFSIAELEQYQIHHQCSDTEIHAWVTAYVSSKLKRTREATSFFETAKALSEKRLEQTIFAKLFWVGGATWDYKDVLPGGPSHFDLFLALVSNTDFLNFVKKR